MLKKVFDTKLRADLNAYGTILNEDHINEAVHDLPDSVRIAGEIFELNAAFRNDLIEYAKRMYGFCDTQHVYITGMGIYNDGDEIELDKENWHFYQRHLTYLQENVFEDNPETVASIDYETDQIIKKFPKPQDLQTYRKKGLVIGYVQSGKTANFTHLISKAASIGYKFIIVLGGMTDTLRMQTQFRLDKELIGRNSYAIQNLPLIRWLPGEEKFISLTGLPDPAYRGDNGDFRPPATNFTDYFRSTSDVTVAIIKKLARNNGERFGSVIGNLINWIESRYDRDPNLMPPVLIIDDEADQASIDSSDPEADPTVINHAIRRLISLFPKSVYVGYTATPFANVFVSPLNDYRGLEDLYPKDFIYALPEPYNYFGSRRFFGTRNSNGQLAYLRYVQDSERNLINDEDQEITEELKNALKDFIFSAIVRKYRSNNKYCGMMIHTDHRNLYHNTVAAKVSEYITDLSSDVTLFEQFSTYCNESKAIGRLVAATNAFPDYNYDEFANDFNLIKSKIINRNADGRLTNIKIINSREDKLNYQREDLQYLICIGGNIMSRGVTIEGLTVTYYLRDAANYDTLLQMGRWFGYRAGYEDLMRIYTTRIIAENFEFVSDVEDDLRREINRYIEEGLTPLDFAPKVRAHMRMMPSGRMGNSDLTRSYSQQTVQTIYFNRNLENLYANYELGINLINDNIDKVSTDQINEHKYYFEDIEIRKLINFLQNYRFSSYNNMEVDDIVRYLNIRISSGEISEFNLILSGLKNQRQGSEPTVIGNLSLNPVKRNLRQITGNARLSDNIVNIGVISDTADIQDYEKPTLIFYFIDHIHSNAFNREYETDGMFNAEDLTFNPLGFTIVFPQTRIPNGEYNYYQQIFAS